VLTDPITHWETRPLPDDQFERLIRFLLEPADTEREAVAA
jgi:hypothetical protein